MTYEEIAQEVLAINGHWTVSQMGEDGLGDMIHDAYPEYWKMSEEVKREIRESVGIIIFG